MATLSPQSARVQVFGDKEIERMLRVFPTAVGTKIIRAASQAGIRRVATGIKRVAPKPKARTVARFAVTNVRDRIGHSKTRVIRRRGHAKAGVNVGKPNRKGDHGGWIHTIATGTAPRVQATTGRSTGFISGNDFVQRGAHASEGKARESMRKAARRIAKKEGIKLAKRYGTRSLKFIGKGIL